MCRHGKEPNTPCHRTLKLMIKIMRAHRAVMEAKVRQTGVYRSQHQILMYIASNPDATQKEIAELHETSTATIAVSLKKLEKGGYIRRAVDQEDNRRNRIQITEKGQAVVEQSYGIFRRIEEDTFAGFQEEDFQTLEKLLNHMYKNVKEMAK